MNADRSASGDASAAILEPERNCWRIAKAGRAAVLIDGGNYYPAVREAMLNAQRSIFIIGWDVDSRVDLDPTGEADDGAPATLGALLRHLGRTRPELTVHILLWDYAMFYSMERELLPALKLGWSTPRQVRLCLDDALPLGASHHQKIVIVDDAVAFSGGLDLTVRRWDTSAHEVSNPARVDPDGVPYKPFHDMQMVVDGEAARALSELARERWLRACGRPATPLSPTGDPWPGRVQADFTDVDVAIARTLPETLEDPGNREVETLYLDMIGAAERFIYAENQYLTAESVTTALIERMQERPDLCAVFVCPEAPGGWFESRSMGIGRAWLVNRLREAGVLDRVRIVHPFVGATDDSNGEAVMVHAKFMIVDDRVLRVGSSNLNNRSMGLDSECDLAIEARDAETADLIADIRYRLLGEHLGLLPEDARQAEADAGSLLSLVDGAAERERGLRPVRNERFETDEITRTIMSVADPREPLPGSEFSVDSNGSDGPLPRKPILTALTIVALLAIALTVWNATPLAEGLQPKRIADWLDTWANDIWAMALLPFIYVLAGLAVFPVTLLIAATAMAFGPWSGFLIAASGSMLSAAATYGLGAWLGRKFLHQQMGQRLSKISRALGQKGIIAVVTLRTAPVAPFTVVNLVCGASDVNVRDFLLGTAIGMAPGIIAMTALGSSLRSLLFDPSGMSWLIVAGAIIIWLGLGVAAQVIVSHLRRNARRKQPA